jgi:hypothetical protein
VLVARLIRPPSADGRTARRAPARNFSTSRAASAHRNQKNLWPAAPNLCIPQQNLYIQPPPVYIQLCIFLAVEGLWHEVHSASRFIAAIAKIRTKDTPFYKKKRRALAPTQ